MNINYKEAQFEFFPGTVSTSDDINRPHFLTARLTLSVENLVILTIAGIMFLLFAFSLGVERGRGLALQASGTPASDEKAFMGDDKAVADMMVSTKADKKASEAKAALSKPEKSKTELSVPAEKTKDGGMLGRVLAAYQDKKKTPEATAVTSSQPKSSGGYTVQVASYKTNTSAQREAATLKQKGFSDVFIVPKGKYVILCIGNFQRKEEADFFGQKKLKSRYQDLRVRSL
jgi:cell division septation protein DedD